jgi:GntR family transcriptional repressor for pyruvate dehydrogenase complex
MAENIEILFKPVIQKRASDAIAEQIKEMIYSGELAPNDRLPSERDLAVSLHTGRMTVREALRMLEESGFVHIRQGAEGGAFVRRLDGSGMTKTLTDLIKVGNVSLQELTEARVTIETAILESVLGKITDAQLALLHKNLEQCETMLLKGGNNQEKDFPQLINFHLLLASFTQNSLLKYFLQSMIDFSTSYVAQYTPIHLSPYEHLKQHRDIFEAIKTKNPGHCREVLKLHLYGVAENVEVAMQRSKNRYLDIEQGGNGFLLPAEKISI